VNTATVAPGDCFTCDVNAGRRVAPGGTIYQDEHRIAEHGVDLLVRGYVVLKPRRHVHEFADLLRDEAAAFGPVLQTISAAMRRAMATEHRWRSAWADSPARPTLIRPLPFAHVAFRIVML